MIGYIVPFFALIGYLGGALTQFQALLILVLGIMGDQVFRLSEGS